jgi:hypothetical protein
MEDRPTRITVTTSGSQELDLRWLRSLVVPAHVQMDVVDLGWRCDVSLARRGEHVVVIGDLLTGQRVVQSDGARASPLVQFALFVFQQRQAVARTVRLSEKGRDESAIGQIAAADPEALLLPPGTSLSDLVSDELEEG